LTSRILLRGLELDRPQFSVRVLPDGSTDLPKTGPGSGSSSSRRVSIGRIQIRSGDLFLNDQRIPLDLVLPSFEAFLVADAQGGLKGDLSAGPGPLRFGDLPAEDARVAVGLRFGDARLSLDSGSFRSAGTDLSLAGELDLHQAPKGEIRLSGPFDLENFERSMVRTGLELKGLARSQAALSIDGERWTLVGTLRGQQGSYQSIPIDAFETDFWWDGSDLRFRGLNLEALGGKASLDVQVPKNAAVSVVGSVDQLSAEPLLRWLFDFGSAGLGSRVSGPLDLSLPRGASTLLSGTGDLHFAPDPGLGDPVAGRFPFRADRGVVTATGARLEGPKTAVSLDGSILPDHSLNLDVKLASEDLATTDALAVRLRRALGTPQPEPLGATGRGRFQGRVSGTTGEPIFTGGFIGAAFGYLGVSWGDINWSGTASSFDLKSDALTATRGSARVDLSGTQRLGAAGIDDAMDLSIVVKGWPAKDLLHVVDSTLDVDGAVSGTFRLLGTRSRPLGDAQLASARGKALGVPFIEADLQLKFEGEALRIEDLTAVVGGGDLSARGLITDEAGAPAFDGDVEIREVEFSDLGLQAAAGPVIGGHVDGRARFSGPTEAPQVSAHLESKRIFYGDEGIGAVAVDVEGKGDGLLSVVGRADSPRFVASVTGSIEAKPPHVSRLEVKLGSARLDPVLRALGSRFENAVVITASANAQVEGPLLDPDAMTARVREGGLRIAVPEYAIEAAPGFVVDIEKSAVQIGGLTLTGEGTSLAISGKLALKPDDLNDLSVTGRADLRVLTGFLREWRTRGSATLRSQIGGSPKAIRLSGGLDLEDGAIRLRTFPQGLEDLNGRIVFNETQARVAGLEGRFGGGRVSVSGQIGFGSAVPAAFDFSFTGDSLGLRYPEGLKSTFGAALRLQGTAESQWLTGTLMVSKALWTRRYAITSELFASQSQSPGFALPSSSLKPSAMRLDIEIKAPGTLRVDNNLAALAAKADLTLTGSPTEPQLLGQVEVERGKVFFRGNTYDVRKGVAHFSNPRAINPVFDIEADTRVRSYRLTLQANGTLDRVSTRITSDPPLTSPQIASLLTGGDETDVASLAGSATALDLKTLGFGGANSLASSWLDDNLTGKVAQGFGLSRLSIDPGRGRLLNPTGSRLTVGKRVTRDLEVVYSRNIFGGTENQLATVEYSISNRFSLVAGWTDPGGFSTDVRTRIVLGR
jgi:autotransporter translocation and assembly factor TamB